MSKVRIVLVEPVMPSEYPHYIVEQEVSENKWETKKVFCFKHEPDSDVWKRELAYEQAVKLAEILEADTKEKRTIVYESWHPDASFV